MLRPSIFGESLFDELLPMSDFDFPAFPDFSEFEKMENQMNRKLNYPAVIRNVVKLTASNT